MTRRRPASPRAVAAVAAFAAVVWLATPGLGGESGAQPAVSSPGAAYRATTWLAGQADNGAFGDAGAVDWGLTADAALADAASGLGSAGTAAVDQLRAHVAAYVSPLGGADRAAGPLAKLLVTAAVYGADVTSFGGWNLRAEVLALVKSTPGDVNAGRIQSVVEPDASNGFSQSLAVIGLARTGTVPPAVVTYLLHQQCPDGGFRLFFTGAGGSCTASTQSDTDTTGLAIQGLLAVDTPAADQAVQSAVAWLLARQTADGSFKGTGPTSAANSNSTGIAAQGLRAAGHPDEAALAAGWLRSLQLGCDVTASGLVADRGAIAYSVAVRDSTIADGAISPTFRDQFRRSTAQAVLGLTGESLLTMTVAETPEDTGDCTSPPGSTSTTAPSSNGGSTTTTSTSTSTTSSTSTSTTTTTVASTTTTSTTAPASTTSAARATTTTTVAVRVLANTVSGSSSSTSTSSGSSGSSGLAVTGGDVGRVVAWAVLVAAVGVGLLGLRRRAD
ncbi:MAG: prenyltransferase/squalene oxidase repeat-containing protein [Acidimicrobiales bacterium]